MGFFPITTAQKAKLMATGKVDEIENEGMDEGRYFVHLKEKYCWERYGNDIVRTRSFGNYREAERALKGVQQVNTP